jgi:hypothetical protein
LTVETWKPVSGFEGLYEVSNLGRVRSLTRTIANGRTFEGVILKAICSNHYGHLKVSLSRNGTSCGRLIHRLVALAFIGPCPPDMECAHNDGDPTNNRAENLRWDTRKGNHADKREHGTAQVGENNSLSKLSEADVRAIIARRRRGELGTDLAKEFNVTSAAISAIIHKKNWAHIEVSDA